VNESARLSRRARRAESSRELPVAADGGYSGEPADAERNGSGRVVRRLLSSFRQENRPVRIEAEIELHAAM